MTMRRKVYPFLSVLMMALALTIGGTAQAQEIKTDWSQQKLEAYASAVVKVESVFAALRQAIAQSPEKEQELQRQANEEAVEAVRAEGLTVDEYNQIFTATRADPRFNQKVIELIEAEQ